MGYELFDQYTYLHYASGIISYFWNIPFFTWIIIHTIFEYLENTKMGVQFINKYLFIWPGGKPAPDLFINIVGDTIGAIIGWTSAYYLDKYGVKMGWYDPHLVKI